MNCATVKEWMPHYIDGLLSPDMEFNIRLHIEACPDCALWLEEARELAQLWNDMESGQEPIEMCEIPDISVHVMSQIEQLEAGRRERAVPETAARRRTAPRTSWMHYGLAVCLTFILLQLGVFENLAYGISEINGQMSTSVSGWFGPQGEQ
ncbi:zf-HC2 domain-containing protein [Paenibacillus sp. PK3_47]|uniref:anti-sigma factor family protein n=1 Tax=Paenibacillus sp. PK3_47 TaxID=2072642 RepID=UPI00201E534D|nr:zf-HC2 domain-containing protein [Paenibacillus sp. PK3_47]